jgi:hypothetical protein
MFEDSDTAKALRFKESAMRQEKTLTSFLGKPEEPKPRKGMSPEQKQRIGGYMDDFKATNGGCLLCKDKTLIAETNAFPDISATHAGLFLYGLCKQHANEVDSDKQSELAMMQIWRTRSEIPKEERQTQSLPADCKIVMIDLNQDPEVRIYL